MSIADLANGNGKKPKVDETGMVISNEEMMQRIKSGKAKIIGSTDGLGTPISETVRTAPENAPPAPGEVGFMENFSNRFQIAMDSVQKSMYHKLNVDSENGQGLGAIIEDIAGDQFWDDRIKAQDAEISEEAKRIKQINEDNTPLSVSNFLKKGSDYIQKDLPELLGSSAGLMGVSLGAGLAGSLAAGPMGAFVGMAAGASVGRYTESLAEAGDAYDATMQALVDHNKTLPLDKRMSKEEMQKRALVASDGTFNKNMALLLLDVPAAMLSFGIGGKMMTNIFKKSALSQMVGETIATNSLASAGKTAAELGAVSAMEGGEEGLQFYIQNQESAKALGKEYDPSLAELWQNDEFRHSVYGGIALGSLMHTAGHVGGQIKDRFQGITSEKMAKKLQQDTRIATMYDMLERGREHELTGWIKSWGDPKNGPLSQNGRANPEELKAHTDQMLDEMKKAKEAYYSVEHNFNENERKDAFIHAMNQVHNEEEIKKLGAAPGAEDQVKARQVLAASNKNLITILSDIKKAGKDKAKLDELKTEYHEARQSNALLVEGFEKTFNNASPAGLTVLDAKGKMAARAEIKKPGVLEEVQAELAGEKKDETKAEKGKSETAKGKTEKKPESKNANDINNDSSDDSSDDNSGLFFDETKPVVFKAGEEKETSPKNESKKEEAPKTSEAEKPKAEVEKKTPAKKIDDSVFEATKDELSQSELEKIRSKEKKIEHPDGTVTTVKNGKVKDLLGVTDDDLSDFKGSVETGKDKEGNKTGLTIQNGKLYQNTSITKPDGKTEVERQERSIPVHEMKDKHGSRYLVAFEEPEQKTSREDGESYTKGIGYLIPVNEKGEINRKGIVNFYAQRKSLNTKLSKGENGNVKGRFLYDDFETIKKDLGLEPMKSTKEKAETVETIKEKQEKELNEGKTPKLPDYLKEEFERTINANKQWLSKVRELAYEGYTRLEIAKKLGIDKEVVNALRAWMNIPSMDHKTEYAEWKSKIDSINEKYEKLLEKAKTAETVEAESYLQTIGTNGKPRYYRVSSEGKKTVMKKAEAEKIGLDKFKKEGAKKAAKKAEPVEAPTKSTPFDMAKQYSFNGQPYKFIKSYLNKNKEFVHQFREDRPNGKMINIPQSKADSVKEYTDLFSEVESDPLPSLEGKGSMEKHAILAEHLKKGNIVIGAVKGTDTTKPYVEFENGDTAEIPFIYNKFLPKEGQQVSLKLNEPAEGVEITDGGGKIISESVFDGKKWMFVNPATGVLYDSNIQVINADGNVVSNIAYYVKDESSKARQNPKSKIKNQKTTVTSPLEAINEHNKASLIDRASKWVERIQEQRKALKEAPTKSKGLKFQKDNAGSPLDAINNHDSGGLFDNLSPEVKDKVLSLLESAGLLFIKILKQTANLNKAIREFSTKLELGLPEEGLTEKQQKELIKQSKKMIKSFGTEKGDLTDEQQQMINIALSVLSKYAPEELDDTETSSVLKWSDAAKMEAFQNKIKHIIRSIEGVEFEVAVRALMNHSSKISLEEERNLTEAYLGDKSELHPRVKQGLIDYGVTPENLVSLHSYYKSIVLYSWKYLKNVDGTWGIGDSNKSTVDKKTADELLNDYFTDELKEKLRATKTLKNSKGEDVEVSYYTRLVKKWKEQRKFYAQKRRSLMQDLANNKFAKNYSEIMQIEAYKKAFVDTGLLRAKTYYASIQDTIKEVEKVFNNKFEALSKITDESEKLRKSANLERAKAKIIKALNEDNNKVYKAKRDIAEEIAELDNKLMQEITGMPKEMISSLFDAHSINKHKVDYVKKLTEDFSYTTENNETLWKILRPQQQRFHEKSSVIGTDALNHRSVEDWIESYSLNEKGNRSYANEISIDIAINRGESLMSLAFTGTDNSRKDATRFLSNIELASRNIVSEEVQNNPRFANNDFVKDHADHVPVVEMFSDVSNPSQDKDVTSDKMTMFDMWAVQMKYFEQSKKDKNGKSKFKMHIGQLGDSSLKMYVEVERKSTEDAKAKAKELGLLKDRDARIQSEIKTVKSLLSNLALKGLIVDTSSLQDLAESFVYNYMVNRHFLDEYYKDVNAFKDKNGNIKMVAVAKRDKTGGSPGVQLANVKGGIYDLKDTKPGKHNVFIADDEKETVRIAKILEEGFHEFKDVELTNGFTFHSEAFDEAITKSSGDLLGSGPSGKMEGISKAIYSDNDLEHGRVIIKSNSIVLTKKMAEMSPALMQIYKMMNKPGKPIHRFTFTSSAKAVGTLGPVKENKIFNTNIFTNKPNIFEADSSKYLVQQDLTNPTVFNEEKMPVQVFRYLTNFDSFDKISDIYKEIMTENAVKTDKFFASIGTKEWKDKLLSQLDDTPQNQQVRELLADENVTRDHPTIKAMEANLLKSIVTKDVFDRIANKSRMIEMPDYKVDSKLKGIRIETTNGKKSIGLPQAMVSSDYKDQLINIGDKKVMFIVRVPTTGMHSISLVEVVNFLDPKMKNTIITDRGTQQKAGSDNDGDARYALSLFKGKNLSKKERLANDVIRHMIGEYTKVENFDLLNEPINTAAVDKAVEAVEAKIGGNNENKMDIYMYSDMIKMFINNSESQTGIGHAATFNAFHQYAKKFKFTVKTPVTLTDFITGKEVTKSSFALPEDKKEGLAIMAKVANITNIIVDNPNLQMMDRSGLSTATVTPFMTLLSLGFNYETVINYFRSPVAQDYIKFMREKESPLIAKEDSNEWDFLYNKYAGMTRQDAINNEVTSKEIKQIEHLKSIIALGNDVTNIARIVKANEIAPTRFEDFYSVLSSMLNIKNLKINISESFYKDRNNYHSSIAPLIKSLQLIQNYWEKSIYLNPLFGRTRKANGDAHGILSMFEMNSKRSLFGYNSRYKENGIEKEKFETIKPKELEAFKRNVDQWIIQRALNITESQKEMQERSLKIYEEHIKGTPLAKAFKVFTNKNFGKRLEITSALTSKDVTIDQVQDFRDEMAKLPLEVRYELMKHQVMSFGTSISTRNGGFMILFDKESNQILSQKISSITDNLSDLSFIQKFNLFKEFAAANPAILPESRLSIVNNKVFARDKNGSNEVARQNLPFAVKVFNADNNKWEVWGINVAGTNNYSKLITVSEKNPKALFTIDQQLNYKFQNNKKEINNEKLIESLKKELHYLNEKKLVEINKTYNLFIDGTEKIKVKVLSFVKNKNEKFIIEVQNIKNKNIYHYVVDQFGYGEKANIEIDKKEVFDLDENYKKEIENQLNELLNQSFKQQEEKAELASQQKAIDIWHGNGHNTSIGPDVQLSNLAHRPFSIRNPRLDKVLSYYSVEHAYQTYKSGKFDEAIYNNPAWKQGKIVKGAKTNKATNYDLMRTLLIKSFQQNPEALETLLNTGNVPFSHSKADGFWKLKFPQLLEEVRAYFKKLKNQFEGQQEKLASSDPELNEFIRARLAKKFPNVQLFNSRETFETFLAKYHNGEQLDINAVGAAISNSVFIDEKKAFQSTAIHEHAHIYWDSLPADDRTKLKILKFVKEVFPNITDPAEIEETAIQVIGEKGVLLAQQQLRGTMLARLKGMLEVFWRKVKNAFGLLNGKESIDKILDDIWNEGTAGNKQTTIKFQKQTGTKGAQSNFSEVMKGLDSISSRVTMEENAELIKSFSTKEEREEWEHKFKNSIIEKTALPIANGKIQYKYLVAHHYLVDGKSYISATEARRIGQPELYDIPFIKKEGIDERGFTDADTKTSDDYRAKNIGTPIHKIMEDVFGNGMTVEEAYKEAIDENNPNRLFENTPLEVIKDLVEQVDEQIFQPLREQGYEFKHEQKVINKGLWTGTADVVAVGVNPITGGTQGIIIDYKTSDKSILRDGYDKPRGEKRDKSSKKREHQVQMGMYANALAQPNGKFPGLNVTSMCIVGLQYKLDGDKSNRKIKSVSVTTDWTDNNDEVREMVAEMHAGLEDNLMKGQSDSHYVDRATYAKDSGVEDEQFIQDSITAFRRVWNLMQLDRKGMSMQEHALAHLGEPGMPITMEEFAMGMMFWGTTEIDGMNRLDAYEKTGQLKMKEAHSSAFEMADPINGEAKARAFIGRWNRFNKNYQAYQKAHEEITRRMTNSNIEEMDYEELLKEYNEMAKMDSVAFNNIAMAKYNEAIMRKAAERQMRQEVSKTELKNTADIDKYDVKFTALSDFSKEHPVVQDMAKDYYRIMRASQSETKQILEKMNKLGKDVIQDYLVRNGKTDVWNRIKAWINPIIDNQEYFAELWDDEGNMKLSTDPSLSTAQKAYLKNLESFNTRRDVAAIMGDKKPKKNSGLHLHEDTFESFMNAKKIGGWTAGVLSSLKTFMGANYYVEEVKIPVTTVSGKRLMKLGDYLNYLEGSSESTFDKGKKMTKAILQARKAKRAGYHLDINGALNAADPIGADEMGSTYKMVNGELRRQYLTDMGSKSIDRNMKIKSQWHFNKPDKFKYTKNVHRAATQFVKDMMFEKHLQGYDDNGNIDHSNALFTKILALQGWAQLNQKENTAKMMDLFVDGKILGIKQPSDMGEGKDKFMDLLFSWTFYTTMPFNVPLAGFNVVIGQVNNFINGKSANALKGNKRYLKDRAKASAILDHLKVVSVNEDINPYDTISSHFTKSAMWMIEKGEEYIQGSAFLGAMPDDVYDSIVVAEDGTVTIPKWTQQEQEEFVAQQGKKITDIQGKYWEGDKRLYGLFATWRLMGQFKTWLPDTLRLFFKKEETNMYGDRSKGILRTTGEHGLTLIRALRTMSLQPVKDGFKFMSENWNNDNDPDAVNMRRELKSLCLIGVMVGAYAMLHGDSPEEKKRGETIIKLIKQIMVPFDLDTWKSIATIPATRTVGLIADLIHQIFTMSVYERASEWGEKGDVKFIDTASKLVPYSRVASTIDQYAGLGIMKNPTYGKKH